MTSSYKMVDHYHDVVVVGAGGAGLRAVRHGASGTEYRLLTKVFPTRSHRWRRRAYFGALGNMGEDDWRWHFNRRSKAPTGWAIRRDRYMCKNAADAIFELETLRRSVFRARRKANLSTPFGGMTRIRKKEPRNAPARRRTAPACDFAYVIHAGAAPQRPVFVEYFAVDLTWDDEAPAAASWPGISMMSTMHRFFAHITVLPPAVTAAPISLHLGAYLHRRGGGMVARAGFRCRYGVCAIPRPRHLRSGCLITEGARGEGGYLVIPKASGSWNASSRAQKIWHGRCRVRARSRWKSARVGVGPQKDQIFFSSLHLDHLDPAILHERLPAFPNGKIFPASM